MNHRPKSEIEAGLCLSPYVSSYPRLYRSVYAYRCRALRRHVHLCLNLDLNLNLNIGPYPALNRAPFQKPLEKPNPALFGWLYGFKCLLLYDLVNLARYLQVQQGERSVGRPLPGKMVPRSVPDHYIWTTASRCFVAPSASLRASSDVDGRVSLEQLAAARLTPSSLIV